MWPCTYSKRSPPPKSHAPLKRNVLPSANAASSKPLRARGAYVGSGARSFEGASTTAGGGGCGAGGGGGSGGGSAGDGSRSSSRTISAMANATMRERTFGGAPVRFVSYVRVAREG